MSTNHLEDMLTIIDGKQAGNFIIFMLYIIYRNFLYLISFSSEKEIDIVSTRVC